jgi:prepilin-type N-terminal cleavage/methylation domain-containing protein
MPGIKNQSGFTLTEILIAIAIMALGFMAVAEMEFLSLRQKQRAEMGTIATNVIQFVSDRDMAEVKRAYLLNSNTYLDVQAGRTPDYSYCNGSSTSICGTCPCDPLEVVTPNPDNGATDETCAAVDVENFDPTSLIFRDTGADCEDDGAAIIAANGSPLYVVKQTSTTVTNTVEVSITYAVKTPTQFDDTGLSSVSIKDSLASQTYEITAHVDDYSDFIPAWNQVRVPHIP